MGKKQDLRDSAARLRLVHDAVDIQRARLSEKLTSSNTRASFILAACGLVLGAQFLDGWTRFHIFAVVPIVVSAVIAVIAIRPGKITELNPEEIRIRLKHRAPMEVEFAIYAVKRDSLISARKRLNNREWLLIFSTWAFVVGISVAGIEAGVVAIQDSPQQVQLPIPTETANIAP